MIADLPVEGLRLPKEASFLLHRLGLERIGQLYDLPRAALARRFKAQDKKGHGERLSDAALDRLDQALGIKSEPISPLQPVPVYRTHLRMAEPLLTREGIETALGRLLDALCGQLGKGHQGARGVRLVAFRTDGTAASVDIATGRGVRDPERLMRLFAERLDGIDPGFGVEMMILNADRVEKMPPEQSALDSGAATKNREALGASGRPAVEPAGS